MIAWELGGDLGHLGQIMPLATAFSARGHKVYGVFRELSTYERLPGAENISVLQAPVWPANTIVPNIPEPCSHAEMLLALGYGNAVALRIVVAAWRNLMMLLEPSLIVIEYAPAALIAARTLDVPVVITGPGFYLPPPTAPMPALRTWLNIAPARLAEIEATVLQSINQVLSSFHAVQMESLYQLFCPLQRFLVTFPELDTFSPRREEHYLGAIYGFDRKAPLPQWSQAEKYKVFCYLKSDHPLAQSVMTLLAENGCESKNAKRPPASQDLLENSSADLYDLEDIAGQIDFAVCHAGHGVTSAFLRCGRPVLMLPTHLEQGLLATRVSEAGLGLTLYQASTRDEQVAAIRQLISDEGMKARARAFAQRYASKSPEWVVRTIVQHCEHLVRYGTVR